MPWNNLLKKLKKHKKQLIDKGFIFNFTTDFAISLR